MGEAEKRQTEAFIHRENLVLFRRCLAQPHTDAEREVLLRLLAAEEANDGACVGRHEPKRR